VFSIITGKCQKHSASWEGNTKTPTPSGKREKRVRRGGEKNAGRGRAEKEKDWKSVKEW